MKPRMTGARLSALGAVLAGAASLFPTTAYAADPDSGREIMEQQRKLHRLRDEHVLIQMRLVSKLGSEKLPTLSSYTLMTANSRHKVRLRFPAPPDIAN